MRSKQAHAVVQPSATPLRESSQAMNHVVAESFPRQPSRQAHVQSKNDSGGQWIHTRKQREVEKKQVIVGKAASSTIHGKIRTYHKEGKSASLYVGNLEPTTASGLSDYLNASYKQLFRDDLRIVKVFPLIKRNNDGDSIDDVQATSFRLVIEQQYVSNLLNPLVWPEHVLVRDWTYNVRPHQNAPQSNNKQLEEPTGHWAEIGDNALAAQNQPSFGYLRA